jgi:hypothetical protein
VFEEGKVKMKVRKWFGDYWPIIALILLAVALFINPVGFQNLAWYGLVALTAIYAWATMKIARENKRTIEEMKQSRLDAVKPSFSLQPGDFTLGGGFSTLYLVNSGGVAKDVKIDIEITKPESKKSIFVPAIDREHKVYLKGGAEAQDQGGLVKVHVDFKDGYNQTLSESLLIDFSDLKQEGREIWGQDSEVVRALGGIANNISSVERKLKR